MSILTCNIYTETLFVYITSILLTLKLSKVKIQDNTGIVSKENTGKCLCQQTIDK